jgi:hypothetical protein
MIARMETGQKLVWMLHHGVGVLELRYEVSQGQNIGNPNGVRTSRELVERCPGHDLSPIGSTAIAVEIGSHW